MTSADTAEYFPVAERGDLVRIVLAQPEWAAKSDTDYWYVSVEDFVVVADRPGEWRFRTCHSAGLIKSIAERLGQQWYYREAARK